MAIEASKQGTLSNTLLKIENIITACVLAVLVWVGTEVQSNGKAIIRLAANQENLTTLLDNRDRIYKLELSTLEQRLLNVINNFDSKVHGLETQVDQLVVNDNQQWPRHRSSGENIAILRAKLEELCKCVITLNSPEKF